MARLRMQRTGRSGVSGTTVPASDGPKLRAGRLEIRGRYARVYRHADEVQSVRPGLAIEFKREQQVPQLGLGVCGPASMAVLSLQVVEEDPALFVGQSCSP
jgi:hypothetical protein